MYRSSLIIILSILLSNNLSAQEEVGTEIGGIRGGFHSATMVNKGSKPDTTSTLNSFYLGFFRDQKIAQMLYLGAGLEYFQNGFKYTGDSRRVMHTISVPVDLKFKVGPVFVLGGLAANFKVSERIFSGDNKHTPSDSDQSHWFDAPVFLGAGVKVLFVSVEARYHWGLIEARDDLYNRYLQIGIALYY